MDVLNHEHTFAHEFALFLSSRMGETSAVEERMKTLVVDLILSLEEGNTCLKLSVDDERIVQGSRLTSVDGTTPLIVFNSRLYLSRYFHYEQRLANQLVDRSNHSNEEGTTDSYLDQWFCPRNSDPHQRAAASKTLTQKLTIISGGPGTGKTSTVVKIVGMLISYHGTDFTIALAAPTGKAAMRLQESVRQQLKQLQISKDIAESFPDQALTLHRLLGVIPYSPQFIHNQQNPLQWDMVIVDEASMVDLALMSKLVDSLRPSARLILVGDRDQLSSVESGAVLSDCVESLPNNVVELQNTYRFNKHIQRLSEAIKAEDVISVERILSDHSISNASYLTASPLAYAINKYQGFLELAAQTDTDSTESIGRLFAQFETFQVLCCVKQGRLGTEGMNQQIEAGLNILPKTSTIQKWYAGKPIMITRNDYQLGLFNGDIGICLPAQEEGDEYRIWFRSGTSYRSIHPARMVAYQTGWAITVHKSQGSEFHEVVLVLPETEQPVLSRELIYTAITRCKESVKISGSSEILAVAIGKPALRTSGLSAQIDAFFQEEQ